MSAAAYVMFILLCEFLWRMHYSFPQNMMITVRTWPEYNELLEILREKVVDVNRIIDLFKELIWWGNVFNNWKCNGNSLCFVFTWVKFHGAEQHIDQIFQLKIFIAYHMERNSSSLKCRKIPVKYQSTWPASWMRFETRASWIQSWNDKYSRVMFGLLMKTLQFWDTCWDNTKHVDRFTANLVRTWHIPEQ